MSRKRLVWKIAPLYIAVTLLAVAAIGWVSARAMRDFYLSQTRDALELRARLLAAELPASFPTISPDSLQQFCTILGSEANARITLIDRTGRVLGDSYADPRRMENHLTHPEVRQALGGSLSFDVRYSITVHRDMMYLAMPIRHGTDVVGVLRTSLPLTIFEESLHALVRTIIIGAIVVVILAGLLTVILSRRVSRPISEMARGAQRFGAGDFSQKLYLPKAFELAALAETLNKMAGALDGKLRELVQQRNEQHAILASMSDGVIGVDAEERILLINRKVEELLSVDGQWARGRLLQACVRSSEIQQFVQEILKGARPPEPRETTLPMHDNLVLHISGSVLQDAAGKRIGALVVLTDITKLKRLEALRKDFVANVSHELKTPITAIKGYVETLREGALEDREHARLFLERVAQNADRLDAIIDDLLSLSRIEQDADRSEITLLPGNLCDVVQSAVLAVAEKARERHIRVLFPAGQTMLSPISAPIHSTLLEQAIINLLDNAIKYSEPDSCVEVDMIPRETEAEIRVRDFGSGISADHLPRLFERFYRVDKGRSRLQGGTGLGLAIVKHIAEAHHGRVIVASAVGAGSTFSIFIPLM
jgi:two-component system, OmpR family, phosphate regulon sensor histidine kinase PhoR